MPMENIPQPEFIGLRPGLRLRAFHGLSPREEAEALRWYQDPELVRLVDGPDAKPYSPENLAGMYRFLDNGNELYWIEVEDGSGFRMVGDVSLCPSGDMPIVIDPAFQRQGIGKAAVGALIDRARSLGFQAMDVKEIYHYNTGSRRLFQSFGFRESGKTEHGNSYRLELHGNM